MDTILQTLPQVLVDGLTLGAVYAVVAIGYTMVYGILEFINFAHGEIFMTGAFVGTAALLGMSSAGWLGALPGGLAYFLILAAAMVFTGVMGIGIERVAYRPLRNAPKLISLISAIGVSFLLQDIVRFIADVRTGNFVVTGISLYGDNLKLGASSLWGGFNDAFLKTNTIIVVAVAVVLMIGLDLFVNRTKWGKAMRAVAQDRETAALMSINVNKVIALTFFIGSALGGGTGVLFAQQYGTIDPYIGFILGMKAFTAAVLGGIGNIRGAMFGGLFIGVLEMFSSANLSVITGGTLGGEYKDVVAFLILIAVLIFKPEGLFGRALKEKV
ncbi:branched-chain amino acid ABC transporter permease [Paenibacillus macerans]|uniref:Branched-chain amino acid transport system / permease component family protein n=1 Tax=Paenibacillus macerans TaxID=44252 RepID=A0A090YB80_PAEMA|nr:branched-chain amino acid ABC transporter permease [Paenibacillus macerans]KFM95451.1 branched-chain amino acid transport system / permease component family protein [Paenibacillus macerans]MCY7562839.1 branched-chain amino acid ABC transporter permease [Paenibacillus macerans]MEC0154424.1 branched-chain amino acid ABC transporter permease [Paenibacillus macerans]MED4953537.1 branched-chain amino acid ABC transporter permease [Paenibacillus macerans]SUA83882.1 putative branched-chain amino a